MRRYSEILRFHDGVRVQATAPEATSELPPVGMSPDAGEQLFVLVDLGPGQAHRSRETRTLAARVYWQSPGGIVARLRRALAEANRYVLQENLRAPQPQSASGNITCAVFAGEELFLGQVGPGNVLLYHAGGEVEIFPSSALPMLPLGAGLPPAIHIGYAPVAPGSALLIATASVAEAQAHSLWAETLAVAEPEQSVEQVLRLMRENRVTGCAVVVHCLPEPATHSEAYLLQKPPSKPEPSLKSPRAAELTSGAAETVRTEEPVPAAALAAEPLRYRQEAAATAPAFTEPLVPPPPAPGPAPRRPALPGRKSASVPNVSALPAVAPRPTATVEPLAPIPPTPPPSSARETAEETEREAPAARPRLSLPRLKLPSWHLRETLGPLFRAFGRALMPGKVKVKRARVSRIAPQENPLLLSSLALGLLLLTSLITLTTYFQFGGASRVETLLADAEVAWQEAYASQATEDWQRALTLAQQVLALDSSNARAQTLRDEAQLNLEMLEKAAVLSLTKIAELGVSPAPRRLLVTRTWIYLLNPVTEEVLGMPLAEDGMRLSSAAPTSILRRGQIVAGATVEHLVDIAWVTPGATYGDGALFIYSDDGTLYVYEPTLGPAGITRQRLEGEHTSRSVTMIATYGEQLYLLDRQQGQLFRYAPLNRLYNSPPRPYFVPGAAPQLQTVLNLGLDGRLYLLLGDGSVRAYFSGAEDLTFALRGLPDNNLQAAVMYVEPDPNKGRIYLGDRQNERIVALDKRGNYLHQFRVREGQLRQLETFVVTQEPRVLYMIAANGLYAALLPEFSSP
ncbi:MAG TPA: hypothetical protein PLM06_10720 [Anaerolineae bacterium]|nr:hypothetical protein [Anaerolineae bacterium]